MRKIILILAILFGCGGYGAEYALAQDVWIFTNADTNETVYVEDESSTWTPMTSQIGSVIIKWVNRDNECVAKQMWTFSSDEGYLLAYTGNSRTIAIACIEGRTGSTVIHDRPDLFAAYQWLVKRHSNKQPAYAYGKRSGDTDSIIEMPGLHGKSAVRTYADLSSAVLMPTQYAENIDIAVCTKTINAEGNIVDEGVWYFQWSTMTGRVRFKTSPNVAYANYGGANLVDEGRYDECLGNTAIAREKCVFFNRLRHAANRNR